MKTCRAYVHSKWSIRNNFWLGPPIIYRPIYLKQMIRRKSTKDIVFFLYWLRLLDWSFLNCYLTRLKSSILFKFFNINFSLRLDLLSCNIGSLHIYKTKSLISFKKNHLHCAIRLWFFTTFAVPLENL